MTQLKERILLEEPVEDPTLSNIPEVELPAVELTEPITVTDAEIAQVAEPEVSEETTKDAFISLIANEVSNNYNNIDSYKSIKSTVKESSLDESIKESIIETVEGLIDNRTLEIGMLQTILEQLDPDMTQLINDGKEVVETSTEEVKTEE